MKVAFFHRIGGSIGTVTDELAQGLVSHGCQVTIYWDQAKCNCCPEIHYKRVAPSLLDSGLGYIGSAADKYLLPIFKQTRRPFFSSRLSYFTYALQVAKDLKTEKCDVVHVHALSQVIPVVRSQNPQARIVLHMHDASLSFLSRGMIERRLEDTDLVVGVSDYITDAIRRRFPRFSQRCRTVYNGARTFPAGKTSKNHKTKTVLFIGRISPEKGVHVLLDAFKEVVKHCPQAQLKIVGPFGVLSMKWIVGLTDDPVTASLAKYYRLNYRELLKAKTSEVRNHVTFTGWVSDQQLHQIYSSADIVVLPSVNNEPFGLLLADGMAYGLPAVATRGGGVPEIVVDGKTGLLVNRDDSSQLAAAISQLLTDDKLRADMGQAARERVKLFTWNRASERMFRLYKEIQSV